MRLKRTGYKSEWLIIEYRKSTGWKIPWRKACGKTKTETGRHQEGSSLLEEVEDTSRGWRYPGANCAGCRGTEVQQEGKGCNTEMSLHRY